MKKVVLDTNILVSRLISPKGVPAKIVKALQEKRFILVTSEELLSELKRTLNYPKIKRNYKLEDRDINKYIKNLSIFSELVSPKEKLRIIKDDPDDNRFIESAVSGKATYIVSGDKHLLELEEYEGIKLITPRQFLEELKKTE